ncbi:MAG TPA: hypothetical protein IAC26_09475 [Candidatus Scatomorpha stercoravium]|nr:hypothetical protein [Candidatus Scatomorpha stercoravium]
MDIKTTRKVVTIGFTICIFASLIGIFFGAGNPELSNYMLIVAVIVFLFTAAIIMKYARCPWCGGSLLRKFFKLEVCPHCHRNLTTGKKKKGHGGRGRK